MKPGDFCHVIVPTDNSEKDNTEKTEDEVEVKFNGVVTHVGVSQAGKEGAGGTMIGVAFPTAYYLSDMEMWKSSLGTAILLDEEGEMARRAEQPKPEANGVAQPYVRLVEIPESKPKRKPAKPKSVQAVE